MYYIQDTMPDVVRGKRLKECSVLWRKEIGKQVIKTQTEKGEGW